MTAGIILYTVVADIKTIATVKRLEQISNPTTSYPEGRSVYSVLQVALLKTVDID